MPGLVSSPCSLPLNYFPALKRMASTQLTANRLKHMKLVASAPSTVAKPSHYQAVQADPTGRVLDDHPVRNTGIPPVELLYPPFGDFLDTVYGGRDVDAVTLAEHKVKVSTFADAMTGFFPDEDFRQAQGLLYMDNIFDHNIWGGPDGHITTKDSFPCIVVVFQNSDCDDTAQAFPRIHGLGRIGKMHAETLSEFQTIYDKFRMPSLVITVVGEWIKHVLD